MSLQGSTVTGTLHADRLKVEGGLFLRGGGTFADINLRNAKIAGDAAFVGSTVTGTLNADGLEVGGTLFLHDGGRFADIDLLGAKIAGDAAFNGSTVTGMLNADGLEVEGALMLRDGGMFAGIRLLSARIKRNVELDDSTVSGLLNADGLDVGGSLHLRGGRFADIDLLGATITRNATLDGSTVAGEFNADHLKVGDSLHLRYGRFEGIDLLGARIAGNAELDGSAVTRFLNASNLEVGGGLYLRAGTFADIDLLAAKVAGDVQLAGSTFGGTVDLTSAAIGGELHLSSGWHEKAPTWAEGASLILRNAHVNAVQAPGVSWTVSGGDDVLATDLTGFTYNGLEGLDTAGGVSMGDESAEWLIGWIEAQRDHGESYDPQPYVQLAQVLDAAGATDKAREIRYAKFEHKRKYDESVSTIHGVALTIYRHLLGYGEVPFRVLYWFGGLVLFGGLLAQCSKDRSVRHLMGLWYSLEIALPIIETNERFRSVEHGRPLLAHYFHFQKVFGFVLATVLVGALTLLGG